MFCLLHRLSGCLARLYFIINLIGRTVVDMRSESRQICAVAWYVFSFALSIYVDYFNGFSMYGSLTTIALIMLWLYFCMYIMMMSAEVNVIFNESFRKWLKRDRTKKKRG
jgi:hypothetical protein